FEAQQWADLLAHAEGLTGRFLFWLDLQRFVATALDRLGARYEDAQRAVVAEVLVFVGQHPQVLELSFADGTPFVDEATRTWLEEEQGKAGAGGSSSDDGGGTLQLDTEAAEL